MNAETENYFKSFTRETETLGGTEDNVHVVTPTLPRPTASLPSKMVRKYISNSTRDEAIHTENCSEHCKFCVKLYYKFLDGDMAKQKNCYLLLEYCENGSLNNFLCKKSLITTLFQFRNLAETLHSMHQHNLFHRDVKPGNIFITKGNIYKIGDFDASRNTTSAHTQTGTVKGTSKFLPTKYRELLEKSDILSIEKLTFIDLYAFGKTLIKCFIGDDDNYTEPQGQDLIEKIVECISHQNISKGKLHRNLTQNPDSFRLFNENIRGFSEFLVSLVNENDREFLDSLDNRDREFCNNFATVARRLEMWLGLFLRYQQGYFCYICSRGVFDMDFVVPCPENCGHCFHVECIKDYLACDTECRKCPLCGVQGDFRPINELFTRVLAKENKITNR